MILESHRSAATLYAAGELTSAGVRRAMVEVERLPRQVRALRVDLGAVSLMEWQAYRALEVALQHWRAARRGMSRVQPPRLAETMAVALRFPHQRWMAREALAETPVRLVPRVRDTRRHPAAVDATEALAR
jgi:hypothetical protein